MLVADPVRLRQIWVNLIGNTVKFTERGEVGIVDAFGIDYSNRCLVAFSGQGHGHWNQVLINKEPSSSRSLRRMARPLVDTGGTGLGLTISTQACSVR